MRNRFEAPGALKDLQPVHRVEAEAVAQEVKARPTERNPNSLRARSIEIMELGTEDQLAYAVGTDDPAGFVLEFGTSPKGASPWFFTVLQTRLPGINDGVRKSAWRP